MDAELLRPAGQAIDGSTRLVAIVADPVTQVKSPEMFNAYFAKHGINAALVPLHVPPAGLGATLEGLSHVRNLAGVVVTIPHKILAAKLAGKVSQAARDVGAVNCLRWTPGSGWEGEIFDGKGFVNGLLRQGRSVKGKRVLLVGTGGAGCAVAHSLADAGVASLDVHDIDPGRLDDLIGKLAIRAPALPVRPADPVAGPHHDLIINATPLGMQPQDPIPISLAHAARSVVVADLIMRPEQTALLRRARELGLATHPGRHLLENSVEDIACYVGLCPQG